MKETLHEKLNRLAIKFELHQDTDLDYQELLRMGNNLLCKAAYQALLLKKALFVLSRITNNDPEIKETIEDIKKEVEDGN